MTSSVPITDASKSSWSSGSRTSPGLLGPPRCAGSSTLDGIDLALVPDRARPVQLDAPPDLGRPGPPPRAQVDSSGGRWAQGLSARWPGPRCGTNRRHRAARRGGQEEGAGNHGRLVRAPPAAGNPARMGRDARSTDVGADSLPALGLARHLATGPVVERPPDEGPGTRGATPRGPTPVGQVGLAEAERQPAEQRDLETGDVGRPAAAFALTTRCAPVDSGVSRFGLPHPGTPVARTFPPGRPIWQEVASRRLSWWCSIHRDNSPIAVVPVQVLCPPQGVSRADPVRRSP